MNSRINLKGQVCLVLLAFIYVCNCVCVSACVCVWLWVSVCGWERERVCVYVCVLGSMCEREREWVRVCVWAIKEEVKKKKMLPQTTKKLWAISMNMFSILWLMRMINSRVKIDSNVLQLTIDVLNSILWHFSIKPINNPIYFGVQQDCTDINWADIQNKNGKLWKCQKHGRGLVGRVKVPS